ncbi:hypothetical protein PsorP6_015819 [Peronosclerospora sorghi]|uniref:Uncharacterized protein n=1 Tax=Peronosclerospora sorghi TaxID=230839 RepID=A0ACC0WQ83_9STRA|nr:hypothetical protein PsorP6_015819 [Peronosclerospora sorghi]
MTQEKARRRSLPSRSFLSPTPACTHPNEAQQLTLSGHKPQLKAARKVPLNDRTPRSRVPNARRVLADISNTTSDVAWPKTPTRKLDFHTPKKAPVPPSSSSDDTETSDDDENDATCRFTPRRDALSSVNNHSVEYHFSVAATVSSVAIAPSGAFLVVGFDTGLISLYPLASRASRHGVILDHIHARGMYTHLNVTISIPPTGNFIFAGVYRGATDLRAYALDSLHVRPTASTLAHMVSHTHSDPKLKGFAAATYLPHKDEYRLLCGLGIKTVHLWRFFRPRTPTGHGSWRYECIFDHATNGISLELLCFHPSQPHAFISKSEHHHVRIWHLDETAHAAKNVVTVFKKAHVDVKHTVDAVAVYGAYAYGGTESFAVMDLHAATRFEVLLPLQEQPSARHMRTLSQVAGHDAAPFTLGRCSDGSVFYHAHDASVAVQAQTTTGLLAVMRLPEAHSEPWLIVAATPDHLHVQSLTAFLQVQEQETHGTRNVRARARSCSSTSDSESDTRSEQWTSLKRPRREVHDKTTRSPPPVVVERIATSQRTGNASPVVSSSSSSGSSYPNTPEQSNERPSPRENNKRMEIDARRHSPILTQEKAVAPSPETSKEHMDNELEQLEQYEPPSSLSGKMLLSATLYQSRGTTDPNASSMDIVPTDDVKADMASATLEQIHLLQQFSRENERLQMNFRTERARLYQQLDCRCALSSVSTKSSCRGRNWRQNVAHHYRKRQQLERRHKEQLVAQLHQLRAKYTMQSHDLDTMQQLQANAMLARQQLEHLHRQLQRQARATSPASPVKVYDMPNHVSDARVPSREF